MQICPFFFYFLFDFQTFSIYNVLFIVGCRGERTVRIRKVEGSIPFVSTITSQHFRCRRRKAYGIKPFRFLARIFLKNP